MRVLKKIPIHPSFLLLFLWFIITTNINGFFIFVGVVLTHELGHYFVAKRLGYKLDSFFLAPYGVSLNYKDKTFDSRDEIKIAFAGPVVNLVLAIIAVSLWWIFPETYILTEEFVNQSIMLALFNLIPAYPMDGGRIFIGLMNNKLSRKKSVKLTMIFNIMFSIIFFVLFAGSCFIDFNPTFALAGCFMLLGVVQSKFESKYEKLNLFKKKVKNFSRINTLAVKSTSTLGEVLKRIELNKHTVFYIIGENKTKFIDEKTIISWSMIYPYNTQIDRIVKL